MATTLLERVGSFALYSRILVIITQCFFNNLLPDHDAGVFNPPHIHRMRGWDRVIEVLLGGFHRWDAVYFIHVAEHGYTYENCLAFFPLYPVLVRIAANTIFFPLQYICNYASVLLIVATVINFIFFIHSAKMLYRLGVKVLGNEILALKAAQLYCINPASIFFSAGYSEASFAFLTFSGMWYCENSSRTKSAAFFGLSGLARSNGIINTAFILYRTLVDFIKQLKKEVWSASETWTYCLYGSISLLWKTSLPLLLQIFICLLPFTLYQYYSYTVFCNPTATYKDIPSHILNYGNDQKYKMAHTGISPWCEYTVPLSYSYVQSTHWDVGFLHYYELKQLPNFLLAAPMVMICLGTVLSYLSKLWVKARQKWSMDRGDLYKKFDIDILDESSVYDHGFGSNECFPYVVHLAALVVFGILFMHVQVITRFIACACPVVYWFLAELTTPKEQLRWQSGVPNGDHIATNHSQNSHNKSHNAETPMSTNILDDFLEWDNQNWLTSTIYIYFHLYFFVGIAAFSNFMPWT